MNIIMLLKPKCDVAYIYETNSIRQGLEKMRYHGYTAIPVIAKNGEYVGTVNEGDFLWHILDSNDCSLKKQENYTVKDILRKGWNPPVTITTPIETLLLRVMDQNFVPVIDDRGVFMGIITRSDIIKYYYNQKSIDDAIASIMKVSV
ncbi:MAG: CBS domain-containing protein [Acutalibacteraceae bacterium]